MDKESIEKDIFTDLFRKIDKNIVAKESGNTYNNKHDEANQIEDQNLTNFFSDAQVVK